MLAVAITKLENDLQHVESPTTTGPVARTFLENLINEFATASSISGDHYLYEYKSESSAKDDQQTINAH